VYINTSMREQLSSRGFTLEGFELFPASTSVLGNLSMNFPIILPEAFLQSNIQGYTAGAFGVPPECVVVDILANSNTALDFRATLIRDPGCVQPAPFWGACCINGEWHSGSDLLLDFGDLAQTPTNITHDGSMSFDSSPASFVNSNLKFSGGLLLDKSSLNISKSNFNATSLTVSNVSSLVIGGGSVVYSSNLNTSESSSIEISVNSVVTISNEVTLNGELVILDLSPEDFSEGNEAIVLYSELTPLKLNVKIVAPSLPEDTQDCLRLKYNTLLGQLLVFCSEDEFAAASLISPALAHFFITLLAAFLYL